MEVQKFRIKRINPDIHWEIPCSGGTNFWPINTSINCSGITMYNSVGLDVLTSINGDILNTFPEELKHCSPTDPCVILWNTGTNNSPNHCTSIDGFLYVLFKGLNVTYLANTYTDSFNLTNSVISIGQNSSNTLNITPNTSGCECLNPLGENVSKIPIFLTQDFNDIGHYSVWDGNISQQEVFSNFTFSGVSSGGMGILVSNSTDFGYYEQLQKSPYTIDWGDNTSVQQMYFPSLTTQAIKTYTLAGKYNITITQDSPWGPLSTIKTITVPLESYPIMAGSVISLTNPTLQMDQASPLTGPTTYLNGNPVGVKGTSTGYFNDYPDLPLDSATHINQYSGMTFGAGSLGGQPCFTVSGITESILGNFQTYTSSNTPDLPPGYNVGVTVPIGGDIIDPITNDFLIGVYGNIDFAGPAYTAYTISSAANSTGTSDGDTPIRFWDFTNGITIFEATSCGLDNLSWGAEECISCPSGDCEYCTTKDEYVDRVHGTPHSIGPGVVMGDWSPSGNYSVGDIVYDVTFNSCCCYMAVENIASSDPWFGTAPVMMLEGVYDDAGYLTHIWEACSPECVSCPPGTSTPCADFTLGSVNVYSPGNSYTAGQFIQGEYGNCYQALTSGTLSPPTGYTMQYSTEWDYIGCVSWICPIQGPVSDCSVDCIGVNGIWSSGQINSNGWGWVGGSWNSGFINYNENDSAIYNGSCYICLTNNVGSSFPCSEWNYGGSFGTPDISTQWEICPLPSSTSLDCVMISGATLDTFDQFGNPITVTGEMFWADCNQNLTDGICFEGRWKCIDQYSCLGCEPILSDDPLYFTPLSFANEPECLVYCEPPAFSCTTPTAVGASCCAQLDCFSNTSLYVNTMVSVNAVNSTFIDLSYNFDLFLTPFYSLNDCNNGVGLNTMNNLITPPTNISPLGDISECCINTVWVWDCENGCQSLGGLPSAGPLTVGSEDPSSTLWTYSADCEQNMLTYFGVMNTVGDVACSWWCEDPFLPYYPVNPGPYQSPCIPCYSLTNCVVPSTLNGGGAGPFTTEAQCVTACTMTASCWTCDCSAAPNQCNDTYPGPCPTLISSNPDVYGPDPSGGLNGIVSFPNEPDCVDLCLCDFGFDCFTNTGATPDILMGCMLGTSLANIAANDWAVSDPTPGFTGYTSYIECCYANQGCCYLKCDDDVTSTFNQSTYGTLGYPTPLLDWPCHYDSALFPGSCNDPLSVGYVYDPSDPWCFPYDCTNALCPGDTRPTCCTEPETTCDCACQAPVRSTGAWNSLFNYYELNDAVYWGDADTDFCCFKCTCEIIIPQATPTPGDASTYDCNHFTPGDPPVGGVPNCWVSCNKTPGEIPIPFVWQATTYSPCSACTPDAQQGYECTPDGCQPSGCDPSWGTGHLVNCYDNPTCDDGTGEECFAQCVCVPGTNPCVPICATYQQELILASGPIPTSCPPNIYSYTSYNECMGVNPVNASLPNCCPTVVDEPQWYCDDSANCSGTYPAIVNVDGTGCVEVNAGDTFYQDPLTTNFSSLGTCLESCTWCCDPNGVSVCNFVGLLTNCTGGANYPNALSCYLATTTATPCDCSIPPDEFWCHFDYNNGMGGCVSNVMGLADLDLFGTSGLDRATDPTLYFTSLINCQAACKFCCDCESNTTTPGNCYLNWYCMQYTECACDGNPGTCYQALSDCMTNQEPCITNDPEYYCDDILGCITYPVVNILMSGPYTGPTALILCRKECQFECNESCLCEWTDSPTNPVQKPPCYTLDCCEQATNFSRRCCACEEDCNTVHPYSYDNGGTLITYYVTPTNLQISSAVGWNSTGPYEYGDIVTQDGCCYVMVLQTGDWSFNNTSMLPSDYYNQYLNELNNSGLPLYGTDLMWVPCDVDCPQIVSEEYWWCDSNVSYTTSYPTTQHSQATNCVQEFPWLDNEISGNPSYGNNVYGTDGGAYGSQVSYNAGGTPFSSLAKCQEWCLFCCDPTPSYYKDCCCCKDNGFNYCTPSSQVMTSNPQGLPCGQLCDNNIPTLIECDSTCCCCYEDLINGGCIQYTNQMFPNPLPINCVNLCNQNNMIDCVPDGSSGGACKICCEHNDNNGGLTNYIVQGIAPCKCALGDNQVSMSNCGPQPPMPNKMLETTPENQEQKAILAQYSVGQDGLAGPTTTGPGGINAAKKNSGPQIPCCIICQNMLGNQYTVNQPTSSPPCKCFLFDTLVGPCATPPPPAMPCELDWGCNICGSGSGSGSGKPDCYDSYYSCMTLTNGCTPSDCYDCVGTKTEWERQNGFYGYYNPANPGIFTTNNVASTYDGWDGSSVIPHTSIQMWTNVEPYWGWGQIVEDPNDGCCYVRSVHDDIVQGGLLPDQYTPSEHWCNWLSGNSADGANFYSPPPYGTAITQNQAPRTPWWVPCDKQCPGCTSGGVQTLSWKCIANVNSPCIQAAYSPWDMETFTNQADCNALCTSYLCNGSSYFWSVSKCNNPNHTGVVGTEFDQINWFINHANDTLACNNYVYTNNDPNALPPGWNNPFWPCPINSGPNCCGRIFGTQTGMGGFMPTNSPIWNQYGSYPPNPNGGSSQCHYGTYGTTNHMTWADLKSDMLATYNCGVSGVVSEPEIQEIMRNFGCEYCQTGSQDRTDCVQAMSLNSLVANPSIATTTKYNHSGLYIEPLTNLCKVYDNDPATHPAGAKGCCLQLKHHPRACYCTGGPVSCDCWPIWGTGTTFPFDDAFALTDFQGCVNDCCQGLCECCESNLTVAGLILPATQLTYIHFGATVWYNATATLTVAIGECMQLPHGGQNGQWQSGSANFDNLWNYGSGTLGAGCCICCVSGGVGSDPDPLNDGLTGNCFMKATTLYDSNATPTHDWHDPNNNTLELFEYDGQWVSCGVDFECSGVGGSPGCTTPVGPL